MPEGKKTKETRVDIIDKIWGFFASLKLVITLLLVLSVLSIAGTIIEQNKPIHEYYRLFKPETVALFNKLGLLDMYHSWWFLTGLALLTLNIIACTMERYPFVMKGMRNRSVVLDDKTEAGLATSARIRYGLPADVVESRVTALATKSFSASPVVTRKEDGRHFFYEKGRYTRLAFFLTHLSVLVIFIGAIVGSLFGFKGYANINEGETITSVQTRKGEIKDLGFGVKCISFAVDFYPNGAPKDYRSDLSVVRDGKEIARKTIRVNDPLDFEGITFYQSSYGRLPDEVTFEIKGRDGAALGTVAAPYGTQVAIPGGDIKIEVLDYQERFRLRDGAEAGPAYGVNIYSRQEPPRGIWVSETIPEINRYGAYSFVVKNAQLKSFTGLQVNRDPGVWLVWIGCITLVIGILMAFFTSHRKLWIRIGTDRKGRVEVTAGGTANKNKHAFASEVERLLEGFRGIA